MTPMDPIVTTHVDPTSSTQAVVAEGPSLSASVFVAARAWRGVRKAD